MLIYEFPKSAYNMLLNNVCNYSIYQSDIVIISSSNNISMIKLCHIVSELQNSVQNVIFKNQYFTQY